MVEQADLTEQELGEVYKSLDFGSLGVKTTPAKSPQAPAVILKKKELPPSKFKTNLERFHFICKDLPSPNLFIDFNFQFLISASVARRMWWVFGDGNSFRVYPNLYLIFITPPGIGKSLPARYVSTLLDKLIDTKLDKSGKLREFKLLNLAPDAITFEKLILKAAEATDSVKLPSGKIYQHSSTTFCLGDEMGMLFTENTKRVVSFLMQSWDCNKFEGDTIKHGPKLIRNICVNFLGCSAPGLIRDLLRTKVLDDGFTGRTLFLYADKKRPHPASIRDGPEEEIEAEHIRRHLRQVARLIPTNVTMNSDAQSWYDNWHHHEQDKHINISPKLDDYYARRKIQLLKLAMSVMLSDEIRTEIRVSDFLAAKLLLARAEVDMHKALCGNDDNSSAAVADEIKVYLAANGGEATNRKLTLVFFPKTEGGVEGLQKIFDYLTSTGQCSKATVNGKPGLRLVKNIDRLED